MKIMKEMVFGLVASAAVSALGVTITKDVDYSTTVVLENFSGGSDPASTMNRVTFDSASGGAATYHYAAGEGPEGTITYDTPDYNPALYNSMRIRMSVNRDSSPTAPVQVFPYPIGPAGSVTETVASGTTLRETTFDLGGTSASGNGLRIDPFNYTNDGTQDQFAIDYIMMDQGRTIGWEFDRDADFQNTTRNNMSTSAVLGGTLSGTASSGDSQVWLLGNGATGPDISGDIYKYVEIRMKGDAGDRVDLFWNTAERGSLTPKVDVEATADGEWHTYMLDFSDEADWAGNLTAFRLDPTASENAMFELDYVRFMETIPEPATLGLLAVMGAGMLFIRRLMM